MFRKKNEKIIPKALAMIFSMIDKLGDFGHIDKTYPKTLEKNDKRKRYGEQEFQYAKDINLKCYKSVWTIS